MAVIKNLHRLCLWELKNENYRIFIYILNLCVRNEECTGCWKYLKDQIVKANKIKIRIINVVELTRFYKGTKINT